MTDLIQIESMRTISITVNGQKIEKSIPESRTLAQFLRYDLGLTGTKIGCEEAECGICTVLVDGTPVDSCIYPVFKADGCEVTTIEGLAQDGELHPLQKAFIDHGAVQCGYCTPGVIMSSLALLEDNPDPSEEDIRHALEGNICRCTGYHNIVTAVKDAAARMARGEAPQPLT